MVPKASPDLIEHAVAVSGAFDNAGAFALSFGIDKFQLAQEEVKLIGEFVGRKGRRANPELSDAIRKWPRVLDLKLRYSRWARDPERAL